MVRCVGAGGRWQVQVVIGSGGSRTGRQKICRQGTPAGRGAGTKIPEAGRAGRHEKENDYGTGR